jgi:tRNA threonylcarbamoyladenosine biosynthesis protein TsaE
MIYTKEIITNNFEETMELGGYFGVNTPSGSTFLLSGDLGAGKITFVRVLAKSLNIKDVVQSPTFNIMKVYMKADRPLIHIDAYRLADFNVDIGLDEYIGYEAGLTVIEWPNFIEDLLPSDPISIEIYNIGEEKRKIIIKTSDENLLGGLK